MKKYTIVLLSVILFFFYAQAGAVSWTASSGPKNCNSDPLTNTSGQKRIPNSVNTSASSSGNIPCSFHGYYSGRWYPSSSGWYNVGSNASGNHFSCPDQGYASQFQYNGAGNRYRVFCKYRDDTAPTASDITWYGPSATDRQAVDNQNVYIDVGVNGWAPISLIQGYFENEGPTHNTYTRESSNADRNSGNTSRLQIYWDISEVDNDGSVNNGKRGYNFFISYIEDEAGNSIGTKNSSATTVQNYNYQVYANTYDLGSRSVSVNQLTNASNVANGEAKNITIDLADTYGNKIIPVSDIGRTIDFNFSMDNDLRKDQYLNSASGNNSSAVFVGSTTNEIRIGSWNGAETQSMFNGLTTGSSFYNSSTKDFTIPFYIYAPTSNTNSQVPWNARMNAITFDVNDPVLWNYAGNSISNSTFDLRARPKYWGTITGELRDQWFIEWAPQTSTYTVTTLGGWSVTSPSIRLEYGAVWGGWANIVNPRYNIAVGTSAGSRTDLDDNDEWTQTSWTDTHSVTSSMSTTPISSLMQLQAGGVNSTTHSYLASVIEFSLWGKQIAYPADIIGKASYHAGSATNINSYQSWVKVVGNTSSQVTEEIVTDQFTDNLRIFGEFTKSSLKSDIEQKVYAAIRNANPPSDTQASTIPATRANASTWDNSNIRSSETLLWDSVLYIKNPHNRVVTLNASTSMSWEKTIIVENGDLYINGDLENNSQNDILGIIVLGWNIYIDPDVRDVHAIMYTNKSIISYDGSSEIDGNTNASVINDQLYILGTVFSENTIGGSRKSAPECPFYVAASDCDTAQKAQKYDLNYLRRYFMYDSNGDGTPDARSGAISDATVADNSLEIYPVIIDYNPQIQQTPPPLFD